MQWIEASGIALPVADAVEPDGGLGFGAIGAGAGKAGKAAWQARAQKAAKAEWQASREVQQHGRQMEARRIRGIR